MIIISVSTPKKKAMQLNGFCRNYNVHFWVKKEKCLIFILFSQKPSKDCFYVKKAL